METLTHSTCRYQGVEIGVSPGSVGKPTRELAEAYDRGELMDIAGLVVGILALVAAALAAWFAYPAWRAARARPALRLSTKLHSSSRPSGKRSVIMYLTVRNEGDAPAVGWRLILVSDEHRLGRFGESAGNFSADSHHRGAVLAWQARGTDDTIEPGLDIRVGIEVPAFSEERVAVRYVLDARGMETQRGVVLVTWPEGQEEPGISPRGRLATS
jgi:hypothetical protein